MSDFESGTERSPRPEHIVTRLDFAEALTILRDRAGLSVRDVARLAGVRGEHSTVGDWFAGKSLPARGSAELLAQVLAVCGVVDEADRYQWIEAWRRIRRSPGPRAGRPEPYRGLGRFEPRDAEWFFGRRALTAELVGRVRNGQALGGTVLLVVGASGVGKSSLLRAGLIPALSGGAVPGSASWPVLLMTPGRRPLDELTTHLSAQAGRAQDGEDLAGLARRAAAAVAARGAGRLVIVVDQFEEVFTSDDNDERRRAFVAALCAAAEGPHGAVVVTGLRADFYAQALSHPELLGTLPGGQVTVGPMSEADLREAIIGPARKADVALEDGLVDLLIREADPRSGAVGGVLPLLSHALHATWQNGQGVRLTAAGYRRSGGIDGAVRASAEKIYGELDEDRRQAVRRLLLSLVHVSPGAADTRRRAARGELLASVGRGQAAAMEDVLDLLIAQRLLTSDFDTVEISHEALLTAWPRLRSWLEEDRSNLIVGRGLAEAAAAWSAYHHDPAALYRGARLTAAEQWAADHGGELPGQVEDFLHAGSRRARRELRRSRQTALALALLLLVAAVTSVLALRLQATTARQRDTALSQKAAAEANALRPVNPALAAQLGLAAFRLAPTADARGALLSTFATPYARELPASDSVYAVTFTPDGHTLATVARDGTARLWGTTDPHHPTLLARFRTHHLGNPNSGAVDTAAFSPDGRVLATGSWDHTTKLWNVADPHRPRPLATLSGHTNNVRTLAFSPHDRLLVTSGDDRTVRLWNLTDPRHPRARVLPTGQRAPVRAVAFSPDGRLLGTGSEDGTVVLWNTTSTRRPRIVARLAIHTGAVLCLAFAPDGHTLATGGDDSAARLWNLSDPRHPRRLTTLTGHTGAVFALAFSQDGTKLATGSDDNTARVWDLTARPAPITRLILAGHTNTVLSAAFSGDSRTLATGSDDFTARLWDLTAPAFTTIGSSILAAAYAPTGHLLATGAADATTTLWNVTPSHQPTPLAILHGHTDAILSIAFSTNGRLLASGSIDGTVRLWDVSRPSHPSPLGTATGCSAAFSPDGRILATGGKDRRVRLWDLAESHRPHLLASLTGHANVVTSVQFSPDGRLLTSGSWDRTVHLWDVTTPDRPGQIGTLPGSVATFRPQGRILAIAGSDDSGNNEGERSIRLWDLTAPRHPHRLATLTGHTNFVLTLAFSPDGHTLASAGNDCTVRLWAIANSGHPTDLATLLGHTDTVRAITFSPGGHTLATAGSDRTLHFWETSPQHVAQRICTTVSPLLTRRDWIEYLPSVPFTPPCR